MSDRPIELSRCRTAQRPATRFRLGVEVLDARRLMASGLTPVPLAVAGYAGEPLLVVNPTPGTVVGGITQGPPSYYAAGTPIPLVALTDNNPSNTLSSAGYTGTVNWGDGSATDPALFGVYTSPPTTTSLASDFVTVDGPEHTYAQPGTYTITVSVTAPGATTPSAYTDTATITLPPIPLTGQLNPASDTGLFDNDGITADNAPNYFGTTDPGATVTLSATSSQTGQTLIVGTGVADASGNWSITTVHFVDGIYALTAAATDASGRTGSLALSGNIFEPTLLRVDTAGPVVEGLNITNAKTGSFQVGFADLNGALLLAPLTNHNNYTANRPSPTPRKGQTFPVLDLTAAASFGESLISSESPVSVTGTLSTGKALITKNGTYTLTIRSAAIVSLSGATLDGKYTGVFPTGNGQAGGNFQIKITVHNGKVTGLAPITSAAVAAKAADKHHA